MEDGTLEELEEESEAREWWNNGLFGLTGCQMPGARCRMLDISGENPLLLLLERESMAQKKVSSYRDLEIWKMARQLTIVVHKMTLESLPKFEMYKEGNQIRRSSKSISSNIVEGFGRRRYKSDYIKFLTYALASCDETIDHLEMLKETGSLTDKVLFKHLSEQYNLLGRRINNFLQAVIRDHLAPKDVVGQQIFDEES